MTPGDEHRDNTPWWEDTAGAQRRNYGTAPLGEEPADTSAPPPPDTDIEATKPLSAAHSPAEEQIELGGSPSAPRQVGMLAAALRDVGRMRSINQDSVYILISTVPREETDLTLGLFVVADGMGGHASGEIASRLAIGAVARHILAELLVPALEENVSAGLQQVVTEAVQEANRTIWEQGSAAGLDMGTTCTAALVLGRTIYVGHVGDSRAYLIEAGELRQITIDHSAVGRLIQIGALDPADSREHPLRSQLYRTVGQVPEVQVDFVQRPLGEATHLLICSDGLWSMIEEDVIRDAVLQAPRPQDACRALIDLANAAGGEDNISAVVVQL
jgi:serine/threonine protein phosphatase PrpC